MTIRHELRLATQNAIRASARWYVRNTPTEKGKGRLIQHMLPSLDHTPGETLVMEFDPGFRLLLDLDSAIDRYIYYTGFYRPWLLAYFDALLDSGMTVVDVGAYIGDYTLWAASRVGATGQVFAFEPEKRCFARLEENLRLNQQRRTIAFNLAVGGSDGEAVLNLNPAAHPNRAQSSLLPLPYLEESQTVGCVTLDAHLAARGVHDAQLLKIDAQGGELAVMKGARQLIGRCHPALIFRTAEQQCSALDHSSRDVQDLLLEWGYTLYALVGGTEYQIRSVRTRAQRLERSRIVEDGTFVALWPEPTKVAAFERAVARR